jgi:hypothetical protein
MVSYKRHACAPTAGFYPYDGLVLCGLAAGVLSAFLLRRLMRMAGERTADILSFGFWFRMMTLSMLGIVLIYAGIMLVIEGCDLAVVAASDARINAHAVLGAIVYATIGHLFFDLRRMRYAR